jgi:uncharacterized repeat protein (TIGR01451 family)
LVGDIDGGGECADLSVTKDDSPDPVVVGENITYDVTVENNGPGDATDVVVTDRIPSSSSFVSATPSQGTCSHANGVVTCNLGNLANGATATIEIVVKARGNPNTIFNQVSVSSSSGDGNATNDKDSESTRVIGLRKLSFAPPIVTGGCQDSTGTILLSSPAGPGGVTVTLHSNNPRVHVPPTVNVPENETSATFTAMTDVVPTEQTATVFASAGSSTVSGRLKLLPLKIVSITFAPNPVHGGQDSIATVTLSCAADVPITVRLTSDKAAAMPESPIVIPAGMSSGQSTIHTLHVTSPRTATITASANGGFKRGTLTIIP